LVNKILSCRVTVTLCVCVSVCLSQLVVGRQTHYRRAPCWFQRTMHTDVSMSGKHSANRYIDNVVVVLLSRGRPPNSYPLFCLSPCNLSLMLLAAINPAMPLFM